MKGNNGEKPKLRYSDYEDEFKGNILSHIKKNEYFIALKHKPFIKYKFNEIGSGDVFYIVTTNTNHIPDIQICCSIVNDFWINFEIYDIDKHISSKFYSDEILDEFKYFFDNSIKIMYEEYMSAFNKTKSALK